MTTPSDRNISWKELSELCIDILDQDQDIEEKEVLQNLIDFIYNKHAYYFYVIQIVLYIFTNVFPFYLQVISDAHSENGE